MSCCDQDSPESCCCYGNESGSETQDAGDEGNCDMDHPCSGQCQCAPGSVVVNALACYFTEINAYSDFLGELHHPLESYHYSPFSAIWHPPNA